MEKSVSVFTLGCRVNQYESLCIEDSFRLAGYAVKKWGEAASLGVVNSCALTAEAELKTRRAIKAFIKANPAAYVAVTGCYAQTAAAELKRFAEIKWIIGNDAKMSVMRIVSENPAGANAQIFAEALPKAVEAASVLDADDPRASAITDRANLKIQDGCDNACAYCIIPRARGLPRSRSLSDISSEAQNLVRRGVAEIILTGINLAKFASEGRGLLDAIDALNDVRGLKRIRLGSIEPINLPVDGLIERMADVSHKLCRHLHIPAQSGSEKILKLMRRPYTAREYFETLARFAAGCPKMGLGSDIICGYHEEGEDEFFETLHNIERSPLTYLHVFTFSERARTLASAKREGALDLKTRKRRADILRAYAAAMHSSYAASFEGELKEVLLEGRLKNGAYPAFTSEYVKVVCPVAEDGLKNRLALVRISGAENPHFARAEFIKLLD